MDKVASRFEIQVAYRHFPLHPETPAEGMTLEELFAGRNMDVAAAQARLAKLAAEEGLPYGQRTMTYNSRLAQELAAWAETQPNGERIHKALFQAYFVENLNLAQIATLLEIVKRVELPVEEAARVLQDRQFAEAVDADWRRSRELRVTGVPTFVIGERGLVGAQPYAQLEALVAESGAKRRNKAPLSGAETSD